MSPHHPSRLLPLITLSFTLLCFTPSSVHAVCTSNITHICITINQTAYDFSYNNQTVIGPAPLLLEPDVQYTFEMEDSCDTATHSCSAHPFGISTINGTVNGTTGQSLLSSSPSVFNSTILNTTGDVGYFTPTAAQLAAGLFYQAFSHPNMEGPIKAANISSNTTTTTTMAPATTTQAPGTTNLTNATTTTAAPTTTTPAPTVNTVCSVRNLTSICVSHDGASFLVDYGKGYISRGNIPLVAPGQTITFQIDDPCPFCPNFPLKLTTSSIGGPDDNSPDLSSPPGINMPGNITVITPTARQVQNGLYYQCATRADMGGRIAQDDVTTSDAWVTAASSMAIIFVTCTMNAISTRML